MDEALLLRMTEALGFYNEIVRRRSAERRYYAFQHVMTKLTEAENEVKTISGQSYVTLKNYRHEDILHLATSISRRKLQEFIHTGTCEHVLSGANPCKNCIQKAGSRVAEESVKLACAQLPKNYGRMV